MVVVIITTITSVVNQHYNYITLNDLIHDVMAVIIVPLINHLLALPRGFTSVSIWSKCPYFYTSIYLSTYSYTHTHSQITF